MRNPFLGVSLLEIEGRKLKYWLLIVLLILGGCGSGLVIEKNKGALPETEIENRNLLIGEWGITLDTKDGGQRKEYAVLRSDGTFKFTFTEFDEKGVVSDRYSLLGIWGLVKNIHFTIVMAKERDGVLFKKDTSNPFNYDAYEVLKLDNQVFKYRALIDDEQFKLIKIKATTNNF